jgi:hypothetical protein
MNSPISLLLNPPLGILISRYLRDNEGTTDGYEMGARLIPDPKVHFDVEFELIGAIDSSGTFIAQNISGVEILRELQIYDSIGNFNIIIGGGINITTIEVTASVWRFIFNAPTLQILKDGAVVSTINPNAGSVTEAIATTTMCMRHDGNNTSYGVHWAGIMANARYRNPEGLITSSYDIRSNSSNIPDKVGSNDAIVINPNDDDWGIYQRQVNGTWAAQ